LASTGNNDNLSPNTIKNHQEEKEREKKKEKRKKEE
jgi:hypothetical protein